MLKKKSLPYQKNISQLFQAFSSENGAILLDSGKPWQEQGRFDLFSAWPSEQIQIKNQQILYSDSDNNDHLLVSYEELLAQLNRTQNTDNPDELFTGGWLGFSHFELAGFLEPHSQIQQGPSTLFWAGYYPWAVVQDHQKQCCHLIWQERCPPALLAKIERYLNTPYQKQTFCLSEPFTASLSLPQYQEKFARILDYIHAGDCYQVNFAFPFYSRYHGASFCAFEQLRQTVPSPFMAYLHVNEQSILSISPEQFIQVDGRFIQSKPIKGTAPRGTTPEQDQALAEQLLGSAKNRAENIMIVDLIRNDLNKLCQAGSVKVDKLCALESFNNVHHLVSTVSGQLTQPQHHWQSFFASFPGGSITGAPKIRACQIIAELENAPRGIYCGSIFLASDNSHFQSNLCIRTLHCQQGQISAWAGGGIVADSRAQDEYQECFNKIYALIGCLNAMSFAQSAHDTGN